MLLLVLLVSVVRAERRVSTCSTYNAKLVHLWLHVQQERWEQLARNCRTAVLLFTDTEWWPLTEALLGEMRRFGGHDRCAAIWYWPSANSTHEPSQTETPVFVDRREHDPEPGSGPWGTRQYFEKISQRVPIALALMLSFPLLGGVAVFDSDITIHLNVLTRLERYDTTFVTQRESICTGARSECMNGGFWRVANTNDGFALLSYVDFLMCRLKMPDQDAFDIALEHFPANQSVVYLDALKYANGKTYQHDPRWRRSASHMVHVNWCGGLEEKKRLLARLR